MIFVITSMLETTVSMFSLWKLTTVSMLKVQADNIHALLISAFTKAPFSLKRIHSMSSSTKVVHFKFN